MSKRKESKRIGKLQQAQRDEQKNSKKPRGWESDPLSGQQNAFLVDHRFASIPPLALEWVNDHLATFPPRRDLIPLDETYMQYLERLKATCPDRGPHATELLEMIASGKGSWEASWRSINTEASKNLYCPICFKCINRVIAARHPACWCQENIGLFYRLPNRSLAKRS